MSATIWRTEPQPDNPNYLAHEALLAKVRERDFLDFPTAFAIQWAGLDHTDQRCSAVQSLAFLCDCGAVEMRWAELHEEAAHA